jgi:hypothetical protein
MARLAWLLDGAWFGLEVGDSLDLKYRPRPFVSASEVWNDADLQRRFCMWARLTDEFNSALTRRRFQCYDDFSAFSFMISEKMSIGLCRFCFSIRKPAIDKKACCKLVA